jgi:jumonji domain-containing protein 7
LNGSEVDEVEELSLVTLGRYVAKNRPFVVRGYGVHWPCMAWTADALRERVTDDVEVASSPHGLADAIYDDHFVEPYTERLSMSAFLDRLADSSAPATYLQSQDGNLLKGDLAGLLPDVCADIAPATELFGAPPDAVNLWVGDARSTTSLHKDPYENLCVPRTYRKQV